MDKEKKINKYTNKWRVPVRIHACASRRCRVGIVVSFISCARSPVSPSKSSEISKGTTARTYIKIIEKNYSNGIETHVGRYAKRVSFTSYIASVTVWRAKFRPICCSVSTNQSVFGASIPPTCEKHDVSNNNGKYNFIVRNKISLGNLQ